MGGAKKSSTEGGRGTEEGKASETATAETTAASAFASGSGRRPQQQRAAKGVSTSSKRRDSQQPQPQPDSQRQLVHAAEVGGGGGRASPTNCRHSSSSTSGSSSNQSSSNSGAVYNGTGGNADVVEKREGGSARVMGSGSSSTYSSTATESVESCRNRCVENSNSHSGSGSSGGASKEDASKMVTGEPTAASGGSTLERVVVRSSSSSCSSSMGSVSRSNSRSSDCLAPDEEEEEEGEARACSHRHNSASRTSSSRSSSMLLRGSPAGERKLRTNQDAARAPGAAFSSSSPLPSRQEDAASPAGLQEPQRQQQQFQQQQPHAQQKQEPLPQKRWGGNGQRSPSGTSSPYSGSGTRNSRRQVDAAGSVGAVVHPAAAEATPRTRGSCSGSSISRTNFSVVAHEVAAGGEAGARNGSPCSGSGSSLNGGGDSSSSSAGVQAGQKQTMTSGGEESVRAQASCSTHNPSAGGGEELVARGPKGLRRSTARQRQHPAAAAGAATARPTSRGMQAAGSASPAGAGDGVLPGARDCDAGDAAAQRPAVADQAAAAEQPAKAPEQRAAAVEPCPAAAHQCAAPDHQRGAPADQPVAAAEQPAAAAGRPAVSDVSEGAPTAAAEASATATVPAAAAATADGGEDWSTTRGEPEASGAASAASAGCVAVRKLRRTKAGAAAMGQTLLNSPYWSRPSTRAYTTASAAAAAAAEAARREHAQESLLRRGVGAASRVARVSSSSTCNGWAAGSSTTCSSSDSSSQAVGGGPSPASSSSSSDSSKEGLGLCSSSSGNDSTTTSRGGSSRGSSSCSSSSKGIPGSSSNGRDSSESSTTSSSRESSGSTSSSSSSFGKSAGSNSSNEGSASSSSSSASETATSISGNESVSSSNSKSNGSAVSTGSGSKQNSVAGESRSTDVSSSSYSSGRWRVTSSGSRETGRSSSEAVGGSSSRPHLGGGRNTGKSDSDGAGPDATVGETLLHQQQQKEELSRAPARGGTGRSSASGGRSINSGATPLRVEEGGFVRAIAGHGGPERTEDMERGSSSNSANRGTSNESHRGTKESPGSSSCCQSVSNSEGTSENNCSSSSDSQSTRGNGGAGADEEESTNFVREHSDKEDEGAAVYAGRGNICSTRSNAVAAGGSAASDSGVKTAAVGGQHAVQAARAGPPPARVAGTAAAHASLPVEDSPLTGEVARSAVQRVGRRASRRLQEIKDQQSSGNSVLEESSCSERGTALESSSSQQEEPTGGAAGGGLKDGVGGSAKDVTGGGARDAAGAGEKEQLQQVVEKEQEDGAARVAAEDDRVEHEEHGEGQNTGGGGARAASPLTRGNRLATRRKTADGSVTAGGVGRAAAACLVEDKEKHARDSPEDDPQQQQLPIASAGETAAGSSRSRSGAAALVGGRSCRHYRSFGSRRSDSSNGASRRAASAAAEATCRPATSCSDDYLLRRRRRTRSSLSSRSSSSRGSSRDRPSPITEGSPTPPPSKKNVGDSEGSAAGASGLTQGTTDEQKENQQSKGECYRDRAAAAAARTAEYARGRAAAAANLRKHMRPLSRRFSTPFRLFRRRRGMPLEKTGGAEGASTAPGAAAAASAPAASATAAPTAAAAPAATAAAATAAPPEDEGGTLPQAAFFSSRAGTETDGARTRRRCAAAIAPVLGVTAASHTQAPAVALPSAAGGTSGSLSAAAPAASPAGELGVDEQQQTSPDVTKALGAAAVMGCATRGRHASEGQQLSSGGSSLRQQQPLVKRRGTASGNVSSSSSEDEVHAEEEEEEKKSEGPPPQEQQPPGRSSSYCGGSGLLEGVLLGRRRRGTLGIPEERAAAASGIKEEGVSVDAPQQQQNSRRGTYSSSASSTCSSSKYGGTAKEEDTSLAEAPPLVRVAARCSSRSLTAAAVKTADAGTAKGTEVSTVKTGETASTKTADATSAKVPHTAAVEDDASGSREQRRRQGGGTGSSNTGATEGGDEEGMHAKERSETTGGTLQVMQRSSNRLKNRLLWQEKLFLGRRSLGTRSSGSSSLGRAPTAAAAATTGATAAPGAVEGRGLRSSGGAAAATAAVTAAPVTTPATAVGRSAAPSQLVTMSTRMSSRRRSAQQQQQLQLSSSSAAAPVQAAASAAAVSASGSDASVPPAVTDTPHDAEAAGATSAAAAPATTLGIAAAPQKPSHTFQTRSRSLYAGLQASVAASPEAAAKAAAAPTAAISTTTAPAGPVGAAPAEAATRDLTAEAAELDAPEVKEETQKPATSQPPEGGRPSARPPFTVVTRRSSSSSAATTSDADGSSSTGEVAAAPPTAEANKSGETSAYKAALAVLVRQNESDREKYPHWYEGPVQPFCPRHNLLCWWRFRMQNKYQPGRVVMDFAEEIRCKRMTEATRDALFLSCVHRGHMQQRAADVLSRICHCNSDVSGATEPPHVADLFVVQNLEDLKFSICNWRVTKPLPFPAGNQQAKLERGSGSLGVLNALTRAKKFLQIRERYKDVKHMSVEALEKQLLYIFALEHLKPTIEIVEHLQQVDVVHILQTYTSMPPGWDWVAYQQQQDRLLASKRGRGGSGGNAAGSRSVGVSSSSGSSSHGGVSTADAEDSRSTHSTRSGGISKGSSNSSDVLGSSAAAAAVVAQQPAGIGGSAAATCKDSSGRAMAAGTEGQEAGGSSSGGKAGALAAGGGGSSRTASVSTTALSLPLPVLSSALQQPQVGSTGRSSSSNKSDLGGASSGGEEVQLHGSDEEGLSPPAKRRVVYAGTPPHILAARRGTAAAAGSPQLPPLGRLAAFDDEALALLAELPPNHPLLMQLLQQGRDTQQLQPQPLGLPLSPGRVVPQQGKGPRNAATATDVGTLGSPAATELLRRLSDKNVPRESLAAAHAALPDPRAAGAAPTAHAGSTPSSSGSQEPWLAGLLMRGTGFSGQWVQLLSKLVLRRDELLQLLQPVPLDLLHNPTYLFTPLPVLLPPALVLRVAAAAGSAAAAAHLLVASLFLHRVVDNIAVRILDPAQKQMRVGQHQAQQQLRLQQQMMLLSGLQRGRGGAAAAGAIAALLASPAISSPKRRLSKLLQQPVSAAVETGQTTQVVGAAGSALLSTINKATMTREQLEQLRRERHRERDRERKRKRKAALLEARAAAAEAAAAAGDASAATSSADAAAKRKKADAFGDDTGSAAAAAGAAGPRTEAASAYEGGDGEEERGGGQRSAEEGNVVLSLDSAKANRASCAGSGSAGSEGAVSPAAGCGMTQQKFKCTSADERPRATSLEGELAADARPQDSAVAGSRAGFGVSAGSTACSLLLREAAAAAPSLLLRDTVAAQTVAASTPAVTYEMGYSVTFSLGFVYGRLYPPLCLPPKKKQQAQGSSSVGSRDSRKSSNGTTSSRSAERPDSGNTAGSEGSRRGSTESVEERCTEVKRLFDSQLLCAPWVCSAATGRRLEEALAAAARSTVNTPCDGLLPFSQQKEQQREQDADERQQSAQRQAHAGLARRQQHGQHARDTSQQSFPEHGVQQGHSLPDVAVATKQRGGEAADEGEPNASAAVDGRATVAEHLGNSNCSTCEDEGSSTSFARERNHRTREAETCNGPGATAAAADATAPAAAPAKAPAAAVTGGRAQDPAELTAASGNDAAQQAFSHVDSKEQQQNEAQRHLYQQAQGGSGSDHWKYAGSPASCNPFCDDSRSSDATTSRDGLMQRCTVADEETAESPGEGNAAQLDGCTVKGDRMRRLLRQQHLYGDQHNRVSRWGMPALHEASVGVSQREQQSSGEVHVPEICGGTAEARSSSNFQTRMDSCRSHNKREKSGSSIDSNPRSGICNAGHEIGNSNSVCRSSSTSTSNSTSSRSSASSSSASRSSASSSRASSNGTSSNGTSSNGSSSNGTSGNSASSSSARSSSASSNSATSNSGSSSSASNSSASSSSGVSGDIGVRNDAGSGSQWGNATEEKATTAGQVVRPSDCSSSAAEESSSCCATAGGEKRCSVSREEGAEEAPGLGEGVTNTHADELSTRRAIGQSFTAGGADRAAAEENENSSASNLLEAPHSSSSEREGEGGERQLSVPGTRDVAGGETGGTGAARLSTDFTSSAASPKSSSSRACPSNTSSAASPEQDSSDGSTASQQITRFREGTRQPERQESLMEKPDAPRLPAPQQQQREEEQVLQRHEMSTGSDPLAQQHVAPWARGEENDTAAGARHRTDSAASSGNAHIAAAQESEKQQDDTGDRSKARVNEQAPQEECSLPARQSANRDSEHASGPVSGAAGAEETAATFAVADSAAAAAAARVESVAEGSGAAPAAASGGACDEEGEKERPVAGDVREISSTREQHSLNAAAGPLPPSVAAAAASLPAATDDVARTPSELSAVAVASRAGAATAGVRCGRAAAADVVTADAAAYSAENAAAAVSWTDAAASVATAQVAAAAAEEEACASLEKREMRGAAAQNAAGGGPQGEERTAAAAAREAASSAERWKADGGPTLPCVGPVSASSSDTQGNSSVAVSGAGASDTAEDASVCAAAVDSSDTSGAPAGGAVRRPSSTSACPVAVEATTVGTSAAPGDNCWCASSSSNVHVRVNEKACKVTSACSSPPGEGTSEPISRSSDSTVVAAAAPTNPGRPTASAAVTVDSRNTSILIPAAAAEESDSLCVPRATAQGNPCSALSSAGVAPSAEAVTAAAAAAESTTRRSSNLDSASACVTVAGIGESCSPGANGRTGDSCHKSPSGSGGGGDSACWENSSDRPPGSVVAAGSCRNAVAPAVGGGRSHWERTPASARNRLAASKAALPLQRIAGNSSRGEISPAVALPTPASRRAAVLPFQPPTGAKHEGAGKAGGRKRFCSSYCRRSSSQSSVESRGQPPATSSSTTTTSTASNRGSTADSRTCSGTHSSTAPVGGTSSSGTGTTAASRSANDNHVVNGSSSKKVMCAGDIATSNTSSTTFFLNSNIANNRISNSSRPGGGGNRTGKQAAAAQSGRKGHQVMGKDVGQPCSSSGGGRRSGCTGNKLAESSNGAGVTVVKRRPPPLRRPDGKFASRADLAAEAAAAAVAVALAAAERERGGSGQLQQQQQEIQKAAAAFLRAYQHQLGDGGGGARGSSSSSSQAAAASLHKELERLSSSNRVRAGLSKEQQEQLTQQQRRFLALLTAVDEAQRSLSAAAEAEAAGHHQLQGQQVRLSPRLDPAAGCNTEVATPLPEPAVPDRKNFEEPRSLLLLPASVKVEEGRPVGADRTGHCLAAAGADARASGCAAAAAAKRRLAARKAAERIFPYCHPGKHESINLNLLCLHTSCDDEEFLLRVALEKVSSQPASLQELERCFTTHGERFDLPWLDRRLANVQTLQQVRPRMQQLLAASRLRQQERLLVKRRLQQQQLLRKEDLLQRQPGAPTSCAHGETRTGEEDNSWQLPLVASQQHQQHVLQVLTEQLKRFTPSGGIPRQRQQQCSRDHRDSSSSSVRGPGYPTTNVNSSNSGSAYSTSNGNGKGSSAGQAVPVSGSSSCVSTNALQIVIAAAPTRKVADKQRLVEPQKPGQQRPDLSARQQQQSQQARHHQEESAASQEQQEVKSCQEQQRSASRGQLPGWVPELPEIAYPARSSSGEGRGQPGNGQQQEQQLEQELQQTRGQLAFDWQLEKLQQWQRSVVDTALPPEFESLFDALKAMAAAQYACFLGGNSSGRNIKPQASTTTLEEQHLHKKRSEQTAPPEAAADPLGATHPAAPPVHVVDAARSHEEAEKQHRAAQHQQIEERQGFQQPQQLACRSVCEAAAVRDMKGTVDETGAGGRELRPSGAGHLTPVQQVQQQSQIVEGEMQQQAVEPQQHRRVPQLLIVKEEQRRQQREHEGKKNQSQVIQHAPQQHGEATEPQTVPKQLQHSGNLEPEDSVRYSIGEASRATGADLLLRAAANVCMEQHQVAPVAAGHGGTSVRKIDAEVTHADVAGEKKQPRREMLQQQKVTSSGGGVPSSMPSRSSEDSDKTMRPQAQQGMHMQLEMEQRRPQLETQSQDAEVGWAEGQAVRLLQKEPRREKEEVKKQAGMSQQEGKLHRRVEQQLLHLPGQQQEQVQRQAEKWLRDEEAELLQWRELLVQLVHMEQGTPKSPHVQRMEEQRTRKNDVALPSAGPPLLPFDK